MPILSRRCFTCGGPTLERKPYCPEHLDRLPDARRIRRELARRRREAERAARQDTAAINVLGSVAQDLALFVASREEWQSTQGLSRVVPPETIGPYVAALVGAGLFELARVRRSNGKLVHAVRLTPRARAVFELEEVA